MLMNRKNNTLNSLAFESFERETFTIYRLLYVSICSLIHLVKDSKIK
jgi:hypothetical protein